MQSRFRWYRVQLPSVTSDLSKVIADALFSEESQHWFLEIESERGTAKFRFFWRTKIVVTRFDEKRGPTYEDIASINYLDFAVVPKQNHLFIRVENPGRNIRDFLNALETLVGMGFTAEPITFEKRKPTSIFEAVEITKLVGLKLTGAVIDEDLVARMEFVSKQGMLIENMKLLKGIGYNVQLAVFEFLFQGIRGQVAFSSNGMVKINGQLAPRLIQLIEADLPSLI